MRGWSAEKWTDHSLAFGPMLAVLLILAAALLSGCGTTTTVPVRELVACPESPPPVECGKAPPIEDETHEDSLRTVVRLEGQRQCLELKDAVRDWAEKVCRKAAAKTRR